MPPLPRPPAVSASVDALCDHFEDALRCGDQPRIEDWLIQAGPDSVTALPELVAVELDCRIRAGEPASAADYFTRFPQLLTRPAVAIRLVGVEFQAARSSRPGLTEADFAARYPRLAGRPEWVSGPWTEKPSSGTASLAETPEFATAECQPRRPGPHDFLEAFLAPPERPGDIGRLGDYHIRGVLGAGGMGVVLTAEDPTLRRTVAVKLMRPEVASKPGARERFLREARSAAAVQHPRVVIIHHVGEWNGTPFLVMPLMAGQSLGTRLKGRCPVPLPEAVRFMREAADGLSAAHARGLTHRDVKPDNIWLEDTAEGTHVRLLDFGLAREGGAEPLTHEGAVMGTPHYMAPEQAAGQPVDGRADLFSLGCVTYELLTGQKPFTGPSVVSVLHALTSHVPPAPRQVAPSVPAALSDLTMRLLEKSPDRRPASAGEVAAELRHIEQGLDNLPETVAIAGPPQGSTQAQLPRRTWAAAVVLLVGVVGLIAWASTREWTPAVGRGEPIPPQPGLPPDEMTARPLRVTAIEVSHFASTPDGDVPRGLLGENTFTPALGDRVQVTAKLSKPGYAYLIAFRPDGAAELCFPNDEDSPPPLTDTPRYPLTDGLKAYGLREGTGLWVFAVIASEQPLPAYRDWYEKRFGNALPWKPMAKLPAGVVWRDDGEANVEMFTAGGMTPLLRGKDEELVGPAATIKRLTDTLRATRGADTASAIGFAVTPRE